MITERLAAAHAELASKTLAQIELETATTWGARAAAAYENYRATSDDRWLILAADLAHEMCEHAAGAPPQTLERLRAELSGLTDGRF
jgi:hypothetical protein